ncbi:MAG: type II/IV secretion system protein [Acidobacteriota bacterium]|nr:MAG: type II/IV secretion system protein [Acidobacteriota bacterium]
MEARALAERHGLSYLDLEKHELDFELFRTIPVDLMYRYNFVPLRRDDGVLTIAIADPSDITVFDDLEVLLGFAIRSVVASNRAIQEVLKRSESSKRVLDEVTESFKLQIVQEDGDSEETLSIDKLTSDASPIIRLIDTTLFNALQQRVSDIHIETREDSVVIKYRIDGVLYFAMDPIDKRYHSTIISRIKVMSDLDIAENRIPQDGRFKVKYKTRSIDFRVSIMPSVHGEDCVIRILDKESANEEFSQLRLDILGFEGDGLRKIRRYIKMPYGMFLVTGPTGSGKTTTLYAALSEIKSDEDKIITIEDPVEYQLVGIAQIPVNEKKGLTFARGLRSILRHDPDKIMVGEIRDAETAQIAIQSALTGHLVFTTVHANNVIDVLGRFIHMGIEPYNFVSALNCIMAQRLVRRICTECKTEVQLSKGELEESGLDAKKYGTHTFYEGKGCFQCNGTGFRGRQAIMEIIEMTDKIREMIVGRRPGSEIRRAARKQGMTSLRHDAVKKLVAGATTLAEINKVTFVEDVL